MVEQFPRGLAIAVDQFVDAAGVEVRVVDAHPVRHEFPADRRFAGRGLDGFDFRLGSESEADERLQQGRFPGIRRAEEHDPRGGIGRPRLRDDG